ncbi:MAG: hypothetical protein AB7E47_12590 [Desulfovibrionaceae bacterium]
MKRTFLSFLLLLPGLLFVFGGHLAYAQSPDWVEPAYAIPDFYHGVGWSPMHGPSPTPEEEEDAYARAVADLVRKLCITVNAQVSSVLAQQSGSDGIQTFEKASSEITVLAKQNLRLVEKKDKFVDRPLQRVWQLVVIDKTAAREQIEYGRLPYLPEPERGGDLGLVNPVRIK